MTTLEIYMSDEKNAPGLEQMWKILGPAIKEVATKAYNQGFVEGVEVGQRIGLVAGINATKPAISDGLRRGSPECARVMVAMKNLGLENNK